MHRESLFRCYNTKTNLRHFGETIFLSEPVAPTCATEGASYMVCQEPSAESPSHRRCGFILFASLVFWQGVRYFPKRMNASWRKQVFAFSKRYKSDSQSEQTHQTVYSSSAQHFSSLVRNLQLKHVLHLHNNMKATVSKSFSIIVIVN